MKEKISSVWIVSREYAGIAEAGGVKNVTTSLSESLVRTGLEVTAFIPAYGFVTCSGQSRPGPSICIGGTIHEVTYTVCYQHGVRIVLVNSPVFTEKNAVYVYTARESFSIPGALRGKGHHDVDVMNILFQRSVIEWGRLFNEIPSVIHCQDAHTATLPALVRTLPPFDALYSETGLVVTIHNAGPGYRQGIPGLSRAARVTGLPEQIVGGALLSGVFEPFLLASQYACLTTVSPWYAQELIQPEYDEFTGGLSSEFKRRNVQVIGITNGIDYHRYTPSDPSVSLMPFAFNPVSGDLCGKYSCRRDFFKSFDKYMSMSGLQCFGSMKDDSSAVYFSYHGRIAWQKGIEALVRAADAVLAHVERARFVVLGQGDPVLESMLVELSVKWHGRFLYIQGYERTLARMAVAISDFLVLPSVFEPCGLEDLIGNIYGTLPVAHATGGLNKIRHGETGFVYSARESKNDASVLAGLLIELAQPVIDSNHEGCVSVPAFNTMIKVAAQKVIDEYSWDVITEHKYLPLYHSL